ncbi:hypothetical protein [Rhodopirellula sp. P2]|uniref:hypothetical protein n=1 Tax=Rhodopirellula sp. P2 TaxID=2127060 RepID=UPI0023684E96|nr:hypothetical protein [Rhodopirellula sp. P2]WDQ15204.1 hypothetical protein PSR62_16330 [Rhodopirellula sp. P2]
MTSLLMGTWTMLMKNPHLETALAQEQESQEDLRFTSTAFFGQTVLLLLFLVAILLRSLSS